jgi:hypothetical protein
VSRASARSTPAASGCRTRAGPASRSGRCWGPDVELRQTDYDLTEAVDRYRASGDPLAEEMVELLERPPTPAEVVEDAEAAEFAG